MYPALIRWFATVVPMCPLATPMYSILRLMGTDPSSKILVIDDDQRPLGVVSCHELLLGLLYSQPSIYGPSIYDQIVLNPGKLTAVCSVLTGMPQGDTDLDVLPKAIAHQSLQSCLEAISHSPEAESSTWSQVPAVSQWVSLHPIACIPAHWSLYDFQAEFITQTSLDRSSSLNPSTTPQRWPPSGLEWVVVDRQGGAIGLLNQQQVWRSLALAPKERSKEESLDSPSLWSSSVPPNPEDTFLTDSPTSSVPTLEEDPLPNSDADALRQVFIQRLKEAQARVQSLVQEQRERDIQSQFKNDLMAYMSHEIKTPVTALAGLSELLLQKIEAMDEILQAQRDQNSTYPDPSGQSDIHSSESAATQRLNAQTHQDQKQLIERQHLYARLINHSSHQLMSLMTVVFDLIHLETGQLTLSLQSVDLVSLCQIAYNQAWEDYCRDMQPVESDSLGRSQIQRTPPAVNTEMTTISQSPDGVSSLADVQPLVQGTEAAGKPTLLSPSPLPLSLHIDSGLAEVIVDEHRFKRLLGCLFTNALRLKTPRDPIRIRVNRQGHWVAIQMDYWGEGIPLAQQAQIFQVVDIPEDSSSPVLKGVGLRLLLALRLTEEHGGTLTWWSNPGEGIHVTILLPCQTTLPAVNSSSKQVDILDIVSVLPFVVIADDDPSRIGQVFNALSSLRYGVAIARSGAEALDKISCLGAKAIILNPFMGYDSESTLLSILRQKEETQSIPVISVASVESTSSFPSREHIDTYLPFPIDPEGLHNHLARLIQPDAPVQSPPPSKLITLLYVKPDLGDSSATLPNSNVAEELDLNAILHPHHCRVIEVDSMEQAELLARVWHPDVIIFGVQSSQQNCPSLRPIQRALTALKDCDELAHLPIVTLTTEVTEFAYGLDLTVFPCLTPLAPVPSNDNQQVTSFALLQVIQLAVAFHSSH